MEQSNLVLDVEQGVEAELSMEQSDLAMGAEPANLAMVVHHGDIIGQVELAPEISLLDVAQSIYNFGLFPEETPITFRFQTHEIDPPLTPPPAMTIIIPADLSFEPLHTLQVQHLPLLFLGALKPSDPNRSQYILKTYPEIRVEYVMPSRRQQQQQARAIAARVAAEARNETRAGAGTAATSGSETRAETSAGTSTETRTSGRPIFSVFNQPAVPGRWVITRDAARVLRLLDQTRNSQSRVQRMRAGSKPDSYTRNLLASIVEEWIQEHPADPRSPAYARVVGGGTKEALFEVMQQFLPIVDI